LEVAKNSREENNLQNLKKLNNYRQKLIGEYPGFCYYTQPLKKQQSKVKQELQSVQLF